MQNTETSHTVSHFEYRAVIDGQPETSTTTSRADAETYATWMRSLGHKVAIEAQEVTVTYSPWKRERS